MEKEQDITANDLAEPDIRVEAPLYGMDTSNGLLRCLGKELVGKSRLLQFPPSYEPVLIDPDTGARWEPFDLGPGTKDWYYGQITLDPERVSDYFYDYKFFDDKENLIPDMFVWGELVVSERVRDIIQNYAPGFCYFSPVKFYKMNSGAVAETPLFKVYIRRSLTFKGPFQKPRLRSQGQLVSLVLPDTWTNFCHNLRVQEVASELPIFLFNRRSGNPILSAELFQHLKSEGITALLESTYYNTIKPKRPRGFYDFETIFPLDPNYREASAT